MIQGKQRKKNNELPHQRRIQLELRLDLQVSRQMMGLIPDGELRNWHKARIMHLERLLGGEDDGSKED